MEYAWAHAAARTPLSVYQHRRLPPPTGEPSRPIRSKSTTGPTKKRISLISRHIRTASTSTSSRSGNRLSHDSTADHERHFCQPEITDPASQRIDDQDLDGRNSERGLEQEQDQEQHLDNLHQSRPHHRPHHQRQPEPERSRHFDEDSLDLPTTGAVARAGGTPADTAGCAISPSEQHALRRDLLDQQGERMPASVKYYQNKQLPATPRLETQPAASKYGTVSTTSDQTSNRSPVPGSVASGSAASSTTPVTPAAPTNAAALSAHADRRVLQHAAMLPDPGALSKLPGSSSLPRAESVSSSGATTLSSRTVLSSDPPSSAESAAHHAKPFVVRNGRTYISDPTLPYPLPVDLAELHRQSLRTLLLFQLFGGPVCSPSFTNKPPSRVLEVGCGSGFWSMMCYRYYARHGHTDISFTGMDIAPLAPGARVPGGAPTTGRAATNTPEVDGRPDKDMRWRFVQHDMRRLPFPFQNEEFDLVMVKDMSLVTTTNLQQSLIDEYLRVLAPGGTIEIWESDHNVRMLRPHVPDAVPDGGGGGGPLGDHSSDSEEENDAAVNLGAYVMTSHTPLSAPLNNFLVEYNGWISRALEARSLSPMPCTLMRSILVQEAETLTAVGSRRLAVPLSEIRWEREGVSGVVTKDGKSYIETKGKSKGPAALRSGKDGQGGKALSAGQAALRRTALLSVLQMIQSLEPMLREVSGKSQDEWDGWMGKMMNDLMKENGTSWGECLEIGAWWAKKRT